MRPTLKLLEDSLIRRIVDEARSLLATLGIEIHSARAAELLQAHGARLDAGGRVLLTDAVIDAALKTAPPGFPLYDTRGNLTHELAGDNVYFTPGSAAINILDGGTGEMRRPDTADYVRYVKLVEGLANIASQATAFIPADVPEKISDSYRLYLSLLHGTKPVVTGAFTIEAFELMKDLQLIVRGSERALREKPLAIFSCCPTAPLKWSDVTCENLLDCARWSVPAELISMPLSGFVAPVTLAGSLVQQTAENLSGVVIHQLENPGAPILWGGSPAIFDVRHETTPMGAVETMMLDCAASEIGKWLHLPTQGYIALSDAKLLDAQAGLETGMGAVLAALSGINSISGPGMLDFESCQSLEKLVLDNEICGMALRLARGIQPREDFPALPIFQELLAEKHLLIADHTRRHLREEIVFPGASIDRANRARGSAPLGQRAAREVERIVSRYTPPPLAEETKAELVRRMSAEARRFGMDALPATS
ncbi:MAG: trimethylamine methyltransferase family protein [Bryobacteraceae bacterium]